jgi:hypothetical protein
MKVFLKHLLILLALLSRHNNIIAQTNVQGPYVSGIWSATNSPYLIQSSILVHSDSSLIIEPGVRIIFQGHFKLLVLGQISAIGTSQDSIHFSAANTSSGWFGIRFDNTPITSDSSTISYCVIENGNANGSFNDSNGGGIFANNFSKLTICNSTIKNNNATSAGGGIGFINSHLIIKNNKICNNVSSGGGGIYFNNCNPIIENNLINSNNVSNAGGGIHFGGSCSPKIINNTITQNIASSAGGGIYGGSSNIKVLISHNNISNNSTISAFGGGGGIKLDMCPAYILNNILSFNSSGSVGGGVFSVNNYWNVFFNNNIISNNSAINGGGLNLGSNNDSIISLVNNLIVNNSAQNPQGGGGIYSSKKINIINNTISNNYTIGSGGGITFSNSTGSTISNTILWGNTATSGGNQISLLDEASDPNFYYNNIEGGLSNVELNGNFYFGAYQNNLNINPEFVSPSSGSGLSYNGLIANWHLNSLSSCIDNGNPIGNYSSFDLAENPRIIGSSIDIGAYEFQGNTNLTEKNHTTEKIYPNPTSGEITIELNKNHSYIEVSILNILMQEEKKVIFNNTNKVILNIPGDEKIHFVKIISEEGYVSTTKILKN